MKNVMHLEILASFTAGVAAFPPVAFENEMTELVVVGARRENSLRIALGLPRAPLLDGRSVDRLGPGKHRTGPSLFLGGWLDVCFGRFCFGRLDGVKDGLLTDPNSCSFDPSALRCTGAEDEQCLTPAQIETVRLAYSPVARKTGEVIYAGFAPGTELSWVFVTDDRWLRSYAVNTFKYVGHRDPDWDWRSYDLERAQRDKDASLPRQNPPLPNTRRRSDFGATSAFPTKLGSRSRISRRR